MSSAGVETIVFEQSLAASAAIMPEAGVQPFDMRRDRFAAGNPIHDGLRERRRTPRKSLIVVLPENHVVSPDLVADRVLADGDGEVMDVILACAGQDAGLVWLTNSVTGWDPTQQPLNQRRRIPMPFDWRYRGWCYRLSSQCPFPPTANTRPLRPDWLIVQPSRVSVFPANGRGLTEGEPAHDALARPSRRRNALLQ